MLFYAYVFKSPSGAKEVVFYAPSEEEARRKYTKTFGVEPKDLVRRHNW